jgi:uncharacterized coiled-coil DUF342 family protein
MVEVIKENKKKPLYPKVSYDIGTYKGYLMWRHQQLIAEIKQLIAEIDQFIAEKDQLIAEKDQLIAEKDQLIEEFKAKRLEAIKKLWKRGNDISSIAEIMGFSVEEVEAVIQKAQ